MGLQVRSETETQYNPVFLAILEDIVGGVTISTTRLPAATKFLRPGTPLAASASSVGLVNMVKTAKVRHKFAAKSALVTLYLYSSSLPNSPGHEFKVGEYVMLDGGASAATIAAITYGAKTNGVGTDTLVFKAGGGGLNVTLITAGSILVEAAVAAITGAAAKFTASYLLRDAVRVRLESGTTLQNVTAGAVVRGSVKESILPYVPTTTAVKTPLTARIRFA